MKKVTIIEPTSRVDNTGDRERLRVAAYARVSIEDDEQKNSLVAQREHFERLFADHPEWIHAGIYYDEGITGTSMKKRDGFNKAPSGVKEKSRLKTTLDFMKLNDTFSLMSYLLPTDLYVGYQFCMSCSS